MTEVRPEMVCPNCKINNRRVDGKFPKMKIHIKGDSIQLLKCRKCGYVMLYTKRKDNNADY